MKLKPEQRKHICTVLEENFDLGDLQRVVGFYIDDVTVQSVVNDKADIQSAVFGLVTWAERKNYVFPLIEAAFEENRSNTEVAALYEAAKTWFMSEPAPLPAPPTVVEFEHTLGGQETAESRVPNAAQARSAASAPKVEEVVAAGQKLTKEMTRLEKDAASSEAAAGVIEPRSATQVTRSLQTTGLRATIQLHMQHIPTSVYEILDASQYPCFNISVDTPARGGRRIRITSFIEGYSSRAVDTVEVRPNFQTPISQRPTLFVDKVQSLTKHIRASLNIIAEDLDTGKVELHKTIPVWLSARDSFSLAVYNPTSHQWMDASPYIGAFVTPNAPAVQDCLQRAIGARSISDAGSEDSVRAQVEQIFDMLKKDMLYTYAGFENNRNIGAISQRLRFPSECLASKQVTSLEAVTLFASLLEAASLSSALVVLPSHALVAWETRADSGIWRYLDMSLLDQQHSFAQASEFGEKLADVMRKQRQETNEPNWFRQWSLRELREDYHIYPME